MKPITHAVRKWGGRLIGRRNFRAAKPDRLWPLPLPNLDVKRSLGHPSFPWNDPSHSWQGFLLGQYGKWRNSDPFFSIKFSKNIGSIAAGRCYTVIYLGNNSWTASGWNRIRQMNDDENGQPRIGGNPQEY